mgnify:CR=1 FL=1
MIGLFKTAVGPGNMELRKTETPQISASEVLIQVKAAGICGSDLHIYNWDTNVPMNPPMIVGHEFSGVITELGANVEGWSEGERVTVEPTYSVCGVCQYCQAGFYNLCHQRRILGFWTNGAFAEYIRVPAERLHRLPETVSFKEGAMTEPLACCVHALLELTVIQPAELVVITGPGTIGLLALQVVRLCGAEAIIVGTGADGERLQVAEALGAMRTIIAEQEDPVQAILDITDGFGADAVVECSGAAPAANSAVQMVRKRGRYTQMGLYGKPISFDLEKVALKELQVTGSFAQKWSAWKRALSLTGKNMIDLKSLITDKLPLDRWEQAFSKLNEKKGIKIILDPQGPAS